MPSPTILVFAGSLRTGSHNEKLAAAAARAIDKAGGAATHISLSDYPLPIYDADFEDAEGVPDAARQLAARFMEHDGVFIASPEYNSGPPALLKNALDWVSRVEVPAGARGPYRGRVFALGAASPGALGGYRNLTFLHHMLGPQLGAIVLPDMVSVPSAGEAFDETGTLVAARPAGRLRTVAERLVEMAEMTAPQG